MIDKLKRNILWVVALLLGYSGWGAAQAEEAEGQFQAEEPLPEIVEEDLRIRDAKAKPQMLLDPFRLSALHAGRNKTDDGPAPEMAASTDGEDVLILQLQSTMRLTAGGVAFFNHHRVNQGQVIVPLPDGRSPILKSVRGPLADVEYMGEIFTLDLNNLRSLKLGGKGGEILLPNAQNGGGGAAAAAESGSGTENQL